MRKTNRRRTNNRRRKTGKKQRKVRGGDAVWMNIKRIPVNKAEFMNNQKNTDMVDGHGMALYRNIYWNDTNGMVSRTDDNNKYAEHHNTGIPYSEQDAVTKEQLGEIYVWMLNQDPRR